MAFCLKSGCEGPALVEFPAPPLQIDFQMQLPLLIGASVRLGDQGSFFVRHQARKEQINFINYYLFIQSGRYVDTHWLWVM